MRQFKIHWVQPSGAPRPVKFPRYSPRMESASALKSSCTPRSLAAER